MGKLRDDAVNAARAHVRARNVGLENCSHAFAVVVATHDTITLTDLGLEVYERAHEPKKLVTIPGGHFDPYLSGFAVSSRAALAWFQEHLTR